MLNMDILLDIQYFNGSTYSNQKTNLGQAISDTATITLDTDNYIYIGYYKPINQIYFDFDTPNTESSTLSFEYYDGSDWKTLSTIDDSSNFTRSGLVQWEAVSDWDTTEINSITKYWIRISTDIQHSEAIYNFIGLILSDDRSLKLRNPFILDSNLLMGQSDHFYMHIAARDTIIQSLSKKGYSITDSNGNQRPLKAWDLLDIAEINLAATTLALSLIYMNLSDTAEDHWMAKSLKYKGEYESYINRIKLSVDLDDDGFKDNSEKQAVISIGRLIR